MARVSLGDISFNYGSITGLEEVDIRISSGEVVGIIGPNGSGKTTLLKVIAGLLKPQQGWIWLNEKDISTLSPLQVAREVSVVPQATTAGFNFSVEEIVTMGRHPYQGRWGKTKKEDREAVEEALQLTHCWELRHRSFMELSGGEQQRVILARALAQDPWLILLDEPTSHLDLGYQKEIWEVLSRFNRERGVTVLAVMHDLNLAAQYCRRLILLHEGKIHSQGSPQEVLTRETIAEVYRCDVSIQKHSLTGVPQVTLVPGKETEESRHLAGLNVHVIGGGGSGTRAIEWLQAHGAEVSAGVLHRGDSDWEVCRALGVYCLEEDPFVPVSEEKHQENLTQIFASQLVILAGVYLGWGNQKNLEAAWRAQQAGIPVILIDDPPIKKRDYTGGRATKYWEKLVERGAALAPKLDLELIKSMVFR